MAIAAGVLLPAACEACAVCGAGGDRNRLAFFWTTVFLSLLPLGMLAGGAVFLRRAMRRREPERRVESAVRADGPTSSYAPAPGPR